MEKRILPYIAPFEVVTHNKVDDCWVSVLGKVFDITPLIKQYQGRSCVRPLIALAGKDLSHWFDAKTGAIRHRIHPVTGVLTPYCPNGAFPDVPRQIPDTDWRAINGPPWWDRPQYQIGILTKRVRALRIINMLTLHEVQINVCCEDTFRKIQERYSIYNKDPDSYSWTYFDKIIDLDKTLDENGIPDERDTFTELGMPQNYYIPVIFIHYKDDMKHSEEEKEEFVYYKDLENDETSGLNKGIPYRTVSPLFQSLDRDSCICSAISDDYMNYLNEISSQKIDEEKSEVDEDLPLCTFHNEIVTRDD